MLQYDIAAPGEAVKADPAAQDDPHIILETHIGGQQNSPPYDENWTGFIGNNALTAIQTFQNRSADANASERSRRQ